jgi:hypothetical protein
MVGHGGELVWLMHLYIELFCGVGDGDSNLCYYLLVMKIKVLFVKAFVFYS